MRLRFLLCCLCAFSACRGVGERVLFIPHEYVCIKGYLRLEHGPVPNDCGPESVTTVLVYHGAKISVDQVTRDIYDPKLKATLPPVIVASVKRYGFQSILKRGSIPELKTFIDNGFPVLIDVEFRPTIGHMLVVSGYSDSARRIVCEDYDGYKLLISYDAILPVWEKREFFLLVLKPFENFLEPARRFESMQDYPKAIEFYLKAIEQDNASFSAHKGLGNCYLATGKREEAFEHYKRAYDLQPDDAEVQNNYANILVDLKRELPVAEDLAGRSCVTLRDEMQDLDSRRLKARDESTQKDLIRRLEWTRRRLGYAYGTLGQARLAQAKWDLAIAAFQQSLEHLPLTAYTSRARRFGEIADCYEKLGMESKAREYRQSAAQEQKK